MKNAKKIVALLLCAVLLVGASVMGTLAYLTSQDAVTNTFTIGNVAITLDEAFVDEYGELLYDTGTVDEDGNPVYTTDSTKGTLADRVTANRYKLVPGHEYIKDPTVTVGDTSEDCFIFVKIENGLGAAGTLAMSNEWTLVTGQTNVWVYGTNDEPDSVEAGTDNLTPFNTFTFGEDADPATYESETIVVTAYAIQADTLEEKTAAELWTLLNS